MAVFGAERIKTVKDDELRVVVRLLLDQADVAGRSSCEIAI